VDYAFILGRANNVQYNEKGEIDYNDRYLIFKLIASRGKQPKITSFKHRFKDGNDMSLIEDVNKPTSVSILTVDDLVKDRVAQSGQKTRGPRSI